MGREVRRVPLGFDWPLKKVWDGFVNPHYRECPHCIAGSTVDGRLLQGIVALLMIAGEDGARGRRHPYLDAIPSHYAGYGAKPTPEFSRLSAGLAGREPSPIGHDACDSWAATKKIVRAAGLDPETWGVCPHCEGEAIDPSCKEAYEAWTETLPPEGDGWQVWETVSEGSPISPVFPDADGLVGWLVGEGYTGGAARAFVESGWAPSAVGIPGRGIVDGISAMETLRG